MNILLCGVNYFPEFTGIGKYNTELCNYLAETHKVSVITTPPYYPHWQVQKPYRSFAWKKEVIGKVEVCRGPLYVPKKVTGLSRIIHELSFALGSLPYWFAFLFRRVDLVICVYPPLIFTPLPLLFARFKRIPVTYHVQDLQVDAARDLRIIKSKPLLRLLEAIEKWIFKGAAALTTISLGMASRLSKKISRDEIPVFSNWVQTGTIFPVSEEQRAKAKEKWGYYGNDMVFLYSGNLGEKQGVEIILQCAHRFHRNQRIHFLIVGEGAAKQPLMETAATAGLQNVRFCELVPAEGLNELLNMADFHLVPQKKGSSDLVMPSKLGPILACGGIPIIGADKESFLAQLVNTEMFGLYYEAENLSQLIDLMEKCATRQTDMSELRACALRYARTKLSAQSVLKDYSAFIMHVAARRSQF